MGSRCCKNSSNTEAEVSNPEASKTMETKEKEEIKPISPYFKKLALNSDANKDPDNAKGGNDLEDTDEKEAEEDEAEDGRENDNEEQESNRVKKLEEKKVREGEDQLHNNNLNSLRMQYESLSGSKVSKVPLEVINEEQSMSHQQSKADLQHHLDGKKSPFNEEEMKNMFESAFEEKFKGNEKPGKAPGKGKDKGKKEEIKIATSKKANTSHNKEKEEDHPKKKAVAHPVNQQGHTSHNPKENSFSKISEEPAETHDGMPLDMPSPVHVPKDKKTNTGPYEKGNWRTLNINQVVPKNVLNSADTDELVLQGELVKFTSNAFTNKYVVLTKSELKIFKSKESFLMIQPPQQKVNMFQIDLVDKHDFKHAKKGKNIFFKVNLINPDDFGKIGGDKSMASPNKKNLTALDVKLKDGLDEEDGENNLNNSHQKGVAPKGKGRKMLLIKDDEEKNKAAKSKNTKDGEESALVFGLSDEVLVDKWIFAIDYFAHDNAF